MASKRSKMQDMHIVPGWSDKSQGLLAGDCINKPRWLVQQATTECKGCKLWWKLMWPELKAAIERMTQELLTGLDTALHCGFETLWVSCYILSRAYLFQFPTTLPCRMLWLRACIKGLALWEPYLHMKTCTYSQGAVLMAKYCEKFVENTKKAVFFLEKHVIRGGGGWLSTP